MIRVEEERTEVESKSHTIIQIKEQLAEIKMECSRLKTQFT